MSKRRGGRRRSTLNGFRSQREKMAWVRSFRRGAKGAGKRRRRRNCRGGSRKKSVYRSYGVKYPKKHRCRHRHKKGGSMVSSGIYGVGDPRNPSGWFTG